MPAEHAALNCKCSPAACPVTVRLPLLVRLLPLLPFPRGALLLSPTGLDDE